MLGHSKLIFSFWSTVRVCFSMVQFMRTTHLFVWISVEEMTVV